MLFGSPPPTSSSPAHGLTGTRERPPLPRGPYLVVGLGRAGTAAARALAAHVEPAAVRAWDGAADAAQMREAAALREIGVEVRLAGTGWRCWAPPARWSRAPAFRRRSPWSKPPPAAA